MSSRKQGKVKWFNTEKGYGFILSPEGEDVFVHYRAIMSEGFKKLREGETVSYLQVKSEKGWQAAEVEAIPSDVTDYTEDQEFDSDGALPDSSINQNGDGQDDDEQDDENPV